MLYGGSTGCALKGASLDWGELFRIAAPDDFVTAAKEEIVMSFAIPLSVFSLPACAGTPVSLKLVDNGVYQEFLSIHPVTSPTDIHHLSFTSQFANAQNPQAVQTRYQLNLSRHTLEELNQCLSVYLSCKQEAEHVSN